MRLVGPNGEQVGIVPIAKALELAQENDLDQVELGLLGQAERILDAHDADLLPLGTD